MAFFTKLQLEKCAFYNNKLIMLVYDTKLWKHFPFFSLVFCSFFRIQFSGSKRNPLSLHRAENKSSGPIFSCWFFFFQFFASMAKQKPHFIPKKLEIRIVFNAGHECLKMTRKLPKNGLQVTVLPTKSTEFKTLL